MRFIRSAKLISFLWLGSICGAAFAFLTQVMLARNLSANEFGLFSSVMAMVLLVVPLAGFGVSQFWLKAFGEEGWSATKWLSASFRFVLITTIISLLVLYIWASGGPHDSATRNLIFVLSFYVLGQLAMELVSGKYQLEEEYIKLAGWQLFPHLARFSVVASLLLLLDSEFGAKEVGYMYTGVSIFFFIVGLYFLIAMRRGDFALKGHGAKPIVLDEKAIQPSIVAVLASAWPFGVAAFSQLVYYQSDIILVKYYMGDAAAGIYNVSFTIMTAVYLFPGVVYQKFFLPKMHRWASASRDLFYEVYRVGNYIMLAFGILAASVLWVLSDFVIGLLFGGQYDESSRILQVLVLSAPVVFLAFSVGATLVTREHMRLKVKYMLWVAILNFSLNIIFIPIYGALGAAYTTLISNIALLFLYYRGAQKIVFGRGFFDLRKNQL
jgi:O-antigen/teichoic acid export membrane protein